MTRRRVPGRIKCRLAALMDERHLSTAALARACAIERLTVRKYRRDKVERYDAVVLARLCAALGVEVGSLLVYSPTNGRQRARKGA